MAVPEGPTEKRYDANGVTTIFTIPFLLLNESDLKVYLNDLEVTSGFTIWGVGNPQSAITFEVAPSGTLLLQLNVPFERLNDYQENGDFLAVTVNRDFDRIWQALKQLLRYSTRALSLGFFDVDGNGFYRAKGNGIINLASANRVDHAATNWQDIKTYVAEVLETGQGPINNAANVIYTDPAGHVVTVQDGSNVVDPLKGVSLFGRAVVSVPSIYALCQIGSYRADLTYQVAAWQASAPTSRLRGGGTFIYDPTIAKSKHNGGYIISPTVPITSLVASTPAFLAGTGETDPSGFGCLVRVTTGDIWAEYFGLFEDASYSWNCKSFNAAIKWADVIAPDISPGTVRFMDGEFRTSDPVILHRPLSHTGRLPGFKGAGSYNSAIVKTTNNTTGAAYPWLNIDAAVIELPPDGANNYIAGADSGGFQVRKLANDQTGYGYYALRSYFGQRKDIFIRGFNRGYTSTDCWMGKPDKIWALECNVGFTMSGTSNHGGNLYAGNSRDIGFDLGGLTYSNLSCACDGTGLQGTTPKVAYKLSGSHGLKLTCGVEKTVGEEFNISNCFGIEINGHSFSTSPSTVVTQKVNVSNSTVKITFDWNLSMDTLTVPQRAFYPKLFIKDIRSTLDFTGSNFGDTDARMPRVLDGGNYISTVEMSPHRNSDGVVTHRMLLSSAVYKKAIYVGSSSRIKFEGGLCADGAADVQFEPTVPLGYAVSSIGTTEGAATDIGTLYSDGVVSVARLKGYVSGGWLYLLGPVGTQRNMVLKFFTAPLA